MMWNAALFWILSAMCVIGAFFVVFHKNPIISAIFLVGTFFALAGLYLNLNAPFLAAVQIIVYAGAIMVLFVFVMMLLNLDKDPDRYARSTKKLIRFIALASLLWVLSIFIKYTSFPVGSPEMPMEEGLHQMAALLFTKYLFPFELTSFLLLVAMVGGVVLAKKQ